MKQKVITEYRAIDFHEAINNALHYGWYVKTICCNEFSYTAILEKQND